MSSTPDANAPSCRPPWYLAWGEVALIVLVFAAQAAWPAPEPNESHYLGKAKHFWNPDWAPHDFFFASADSHRVFSTSFGWLTRHMSLASFAWCGRAITWLLLAWGWRRLSWAVSGRAGWAVLSSFVFLSLNVTCHWAGEWVVGGFEAKGLAYALVFFALAALVEGRWNRCWLFLGAASAWHVLVGGWTALTVAWSWLVCKQHRPPTRTMFWSISIGALMALAGLVPSLALNWDVTPDVAAEANEIYVFERLKHHLLPQVFPPWLIARHLLLLLGWLALFHLRESSPKLRRFGGAVMGALVIELGGLAIGLFADLYPTLAAGWLRLYWFRSADVMLPAGVSLLGTEAMTRWERRRWLAAAGAVVGCLVLVFCHRGEYAAAGLFDKRSEHLMARLFDRPSRADKAGKVLNAADWIDACHWVAGHTPSDATFLTPRLAQTFTWHSGRGQVASWKDVPQDASAIVEWWRRIKAIHGTRDPTWQGEWHDSLALRSTKALRRLGREYHAQYLLTERHPRLALKLLYENNSYAVYELPR